LGRFRNVSVIKGFACDLRDCGLRGGLSGRAAGWPDAGAPEGTGSVRELQGQQQQQGHEHSCYERDGHARPSVVVVMQLGSRGVAHGAPAF
jgi:hypothetical protein